MVLDLDLFRPDKGGDPERVKANVRKRFDNEESVDKVISLDSQWRKFRFTLDQLNKAKNTISKEYGIRMKQNRNKPQQQPLTDTSIQGDCKTVQKQQEFTPSETTNKCDLNKQPTSSNSPIHTSTKTTTQQETNQPSSLDLTSLLASINSISADVDLEQLKGMRAQVEEQIIHVNKQMEDCENNRDEVLREIGNLVHNDVPVSNDEDNNAIVRTYGIDNILKPEDVGLDKLKIHVDLIEMIGGLNSEKGSMISGSRGFFLMDAAIWLQQALIQYALRFIDEAGFQTLYTPFWMRKTIMGQVAQLSQFDEELYKIISSKGAEDSEEKYLIATSEQPIAALHLNEWLDANLLPLRYAGYSTCFRQEVGSHGRDTRGIFRVHQFEKIEQFVVSAPSKSWEHFHEMIGNAEKFYQSLELPYRVVNIVSGALNNAAAMKYDLEAYFPGSQAYRELVSVSNCTDYQSRRLQIRFGQTKKMSGQVEYVHMLNGTLCAVTRVICCILENYQTKNGIKIPKVLQEFMPKKFREFIPFKEAQKPVATEPKEALSVKQSS